MGRGTMSAVIIETPRLMLRPATVADVEDITRAKQGVWDQLQLWMSWAYDGDETYEATLARFKERDPENAYSVLLGFCRMTGQIAAFTGLDKERGREGGYHTGYWVTKDFLGKGYATEACNAAIRYAFGALDAKVISIAYYDGNEKSRRIIEKLGFEFERTDLQAHPRCLDGVLQDEHHFLLHRPDHLPDLDVRWSAEP